MKYKALLIAVNLNKSSAYASLPNTQNDVREIKRLLLELPTNFDDHDVQELSSTVAKRGIISTALNEFFSEATSEDILFLYWAGHGDVEHGEGFLVPFDGDPADCAHTMIKMTDLRKLIDSTRAEVVVCFIDTCHSGSIARSQDALRGLQITGTGKVIFAACESHQSAYDRNGHGAFTDYLIQGLSGLAANHEGVVDTYNLYSFISTKLTHEFGTGKQNPVLSASTLIGHPIAIKRIIGRSDSPKQETIVEEIIDSSGTSFWLENISEEYDEFAELEPGRYKITINNPNTILENAIRRQYEQRTNTNFSVRNYACLVKINNMQVVSGIKGEKLEIDLTKMEGDHESSMTDMSFGGGNGKSFSADEIATIRASRILLGQPEPHKENDFFSESLFESMINKPTNSSVKEIVPSLISKLQQEGYKPARIRVITIGFLILSGTVERIETLQFKVINDSVKEVEFKGYRKKHYSNVEPYCINISGSI